jgi:hypothetical protein
MDALVSISNMNNSKNIQQNFEPFLSMDIETKGIVPLTKFVWLNAGVSVIMHNLGGVIHFYDYFASPAKICVLNSKSQPETSRNCLGKLGILNLKIILLLIARFNRH